MSRSIPPYVRNAQRGDSCFLSIITLLKNCGADVFWRLTGFWANSAGFDSADSSRTCALADSFFVMPISLRVGVRSFTGTLWLPVTILLLLF